MTIPTSIPETPMAHTNHESFQESKEDSTSPRSMEVLQYVINEEMDIQNEGEIQSLKMWMSYRGFETFTALCNVFPTYWTIFITTVNTEWMVQDLP